MKKIICQCDICKYERMYYEGDMQIDFEFYETFLFGKLLICNNCEHAILSLTKENKVKLLNHLNNYNNDLIDIKKQED